VQPLEDIASEMADTEGAVKIPMVEIGDTEVQYISPRPSPKSVYDSVLLGYGGGEVGGDPDILLDELDLTDGAVSPRRVASSSPSRRLSESDLMQPQPEPDSEVPSVALPLRMKKPARRNRKSI
jgi:hypothetical protein